MSQHEPKKPYVYLANPFSDIEEPAAFAIGGPGSEKYEGQRFTRLEALKIVEQLVKETYGKEETETP